MSNGHFVWHDLRTGDPARAQDFYGQLLGWRFETTEMGDGPYTVAYAGKIAIGGINGLDTDGDLPHWISYITTDNAADSTSAIVNGGGQIDVPPFEIPGVGTMSYVRDPEGARFAPFQDSNPANVPAPPSMPPAPGSAAWHELLTRDAAKAIAFYTALTGWVHVEWPMGDSVVYHGMMIGEVPVAGIWPDPADNTPAWTIYFETNGSMDDAVAAVERLGGTLISERAVVEGTGEFVQVLDPTGAPFGLLTSEQMG